MEWKGRRVNTDLYTEDEQAWLAMHRRIDDGLHLCDECDAFGWHTFCGDCGARYLGAGKVWRDCPECKRTVSTDWCPMCGARVADDFIRSLEDGTVDIEAEQAIAAGIMEKFYAVRPEWAPEHWTRRQSPTMQDKILEAFSGR